MNTKRILVILAALVLALSSLACGGGSSVGEDIDVDTLNGTAAPRLGERTAAPTTKPAVAATNRPAATAPPKTAAPAAKPSIVIKIQSDNAPGGSQFDPRVARVRVGSIVRWTNADTNPNRSVVADNGAFRSPRIPVGGHWDYTAETAGSINYHDGSRPYAVGTLEVA